MEKSGGGVLVAFAGVVLLIMGFNGSLGRTWAAITSGSGAASGSGSGAVSNPTPGFTGGGSSGNSGGGDFGGTDENGNPTDGQGNPITNKSPIIDPRLGALSMIAADADTLKYSVGLGGAGVPGFGVNPYQFVPAQQAALKPAWEA